MKYVRSYEKLYVNVIIVSYSKINIYNFYKKG